MRAPTARPSAVGRPRGRQLVVTEVGGVGRRVEQHLADVDGLAPVDEDLVALGQDGHPAALQALDEVDLPQRAVAVQRPRGDPGHQLAQLVVVARTGQGGAAYVVADLEVRVVDPHRVGEAARHGLEPLAVARHERDPVGDELDEAGVVEPGVAGLEDLDRGVVHRRRGGLGGQQGQVPRPQPLGHVSPFVVVSDTPGAPRGRPGRRRCGSTWDSGRGSHPERRESNADTGHGPRTPLAGGTHARDAARPAGHDPAAADAGRHGLRRRHPGRAGDERGLHAVGHVGAVEHQRLARGRRRHAEPRAGPARPSRSPSRATP